MSDVEWLHYFDNLQSALEESRRWQGIVEPLFHAARQKLSIFCEAMQYALPVADGGVEVEFAIQRSTNHDQHCLIGNCENSSIYSFSCSHQLQTPNSHPISYLPRNCIHDCTSFFRSVVLDRFAKILLFSILAPRSDHLAIVMIDCNSHPQKNYVPCSHHRHSKQFVFHIGIDAATSQAAMAHRTGEMDNLTYS